MFAISLEGIDTSVALTVAERLRTAVVEATDVPLTVSIGLADFPKDAGSKDELLHKAGLALQQAKLRGKNRVYFFERKALPYKGDLPKVLIVDDDERSLKLLSGLLHGLECEIIKSTSGTECLHLLEKVDIDLVLLDVMMPGIDGFEVCRHIKQHENSRMIPVIFVTALDDREAKIRGIEAGADDFITKPPNKLELMARTKTLINLKRVNNNLTSVENVLFSLANSVEAKGVNTQGHIERVANMAVMLGERLDLSQKEIKALRFGGMLHDIGKIGIPEQVLNKPGPLSPEESALMKEHPEIGYKICLPLKKVLGPALNVIRYHHEKLDGNGDPDGLKGDELPVVSRIMAVVDIYDALISDRPYRQGLPKEETLTILRREAQDGKLDSMIVESLIAMLS